MASASKSQPPEISNVPKHVAIIMDGNGRWAEARGKPALRRPRVPAPTDRSQRDAAGHAPTIGVD